MGRNKRTEISFPNQPTLDERTGKQFLICDLEFRRLSVKTNMRRIHLSLILLIGAILWGILLIISGIMVSLDWLRPLTTVSGILLLLIGVFDRWLWRLSIFRGWLVRRPYINGTWQVNLFSSWIDPNTDQPTPSIKGYMTIWQTYSLLNMRLFTNESKSTLIGSEIVPDKDDCTAPLEIKSVLRE